MAAIAVVVTVLALPAGAEGKVWCGGERPPASVQLDGVPAVPESGVVYTAEVVTSNKHAVNAEPVLMLLRCEGQRGNDVVQLTPEGSATTGAALSRFSVEFTQPGNWIVTLMDRSGTFFDAGRYEVRAPSAKTSSADETGLGSATVGGLVGGAAIAGAAALLIRRRFAHTH